MRLHLFTPYHEEALADGSPRYCPGRAARSLMARCWQLPALWAGPGDCILRPDEAAESLPPMLCGRQAVGWGDLRDRMAGMPPDEVCPWGWNPLVVRRLLESGVPAALLPDEGRLRRLRLLDSRHTTVRLLPLIRRLVAGTVGEAVVLENEADVWRWVDERGCVVAKSLWSCSGRGVFTLKRDMTGNLRSRVRNVLRRQHGIELEPLYRRVMDLALEYEVHAGGRVTYEGLSVFRTQENGAYAGNLVGSQEALWRCVPPGLHPVLESVRSAYVGLIAEHIAPDYHGPLGIDMMVVRTDGDPALRLHPCVEVNLRPTMGYAALWAGRRFPQSCELSLFHPDAPEAGTLCTPLPAGTISSEI